MKELIENLEVFRMNKEDIKQLDESTEVTAAKIEKTQEEISPREEIQQKISKHLMDVYNRIIVGNIETSMWDFIEESKWRFTEGGEVKAVNKDSTKYRGISLNESYYQVKLLVQKHQADIIEPIDVIPLITSFENAIGRKADASSKKPWQYGSIAYRQMWYFKEDNVALVIRTAWKNRESLEDGNWNIANSYVQVAAFMYYTVSEADLKQFLENVPLTYQVIEKMFNVACYDDNYVIDLPIQTISLTTKKIPKKFREYNQLFKLPNASIISLKFTDDRKAIENFVEKATGLRECPDILPKWYAPEEGVCYNSDGECPEYFNGEIPNAKGKLKDKDIYRYQFKVVSKKEFDTIDRSKGEMGYEIQRELDGPTYYLKKVEPKETPWQEHINKLFWTDFENSFAFYYNNEGALQKVNIDGYQNVSNFDIVRLYDSGLSDTQINLGPAMREGGRETRWFEENEEDAYKLRDMCADLLRNVKDYTNVQGADLVEVEMMAQQRQVVSSHVIRSYMNKHPEFTPLYVKFFSQVGATDLLNNYNEGYGNRDAVSLAKMIENGIDFDAVTAEIKKLESEHLEIARDPEANTPLLPKNIKNFTTRWPLFAQQAIAVSMANNQKTAILDVDMGGGKTCMMVADICNQLTKGTAHKPLIVCPNKTLVQNKNEIVNKWTDNRMNVFILNTQTYNDITDHGKHKDKLVEVMNKMPPNTIFMTSYNFLTRDKYKVPIEETRGSSGELTGFDYVTKYPIPKILIQDVGVDMIYCDESQYIKNSTSGMSNAVAALSGANIKRITSGTIIPNNPIDLFAQLRFVDPSILGSKAAFIRRYAEFGDGRGKIIKWKDGAQKQIREQIERKGGVSIRRSMWRWLMPKLEEKVHFVDLTPAQANMYEFILTLAIEEIMSDPKLRAAYELLKEQGDQEVNDIDERAGDNASMKVLSILSRVTGFLAAPNTNVLVRTFEDLKKKEEAKKIQDKANSLQFSEEDMIGPKIYKMKEIISKHFEGHKDWREVGKVIVFTERIKVSEHAFDYLGEWKKHAVQYQAGKDSELERFKTDDNIWIIIAVDKSIKEGQNLQMASRIIRLDIPWTPGDLNQSYARAYRTGQQKDVAVDIILCDGSMEICKYNNLISKEYVARKIISSFDEGDDKDFIPVKMNIKNMQEFKWQDMCMPYIDMHKRINEQELEESAVFGEKYKNYLAAGISKVGSAEDIPGSEEVYVPETSEDLLVVDDEGKVVTTKKGRVKRRRKSFTVDDIGVKLSELKDRYEEEDDVDSDDVSEEPELNLDSEEDANEEQIEDAKKADEKNEKDKGLHLYFMQWDEGLYLFTFYNKSSKFLVSLKFKKDNDIYYVKPINTIQDIAALDAKLTKKGYKTNLKDYLKDTSLKKLFAKKKTPGALQRLQKHNVAVASKEIDFYISRIEGQMFLLTFDKTIDGFKKLVKGLWYTCKNKSSTDIILKKIVKKASITNLDELALDYKARFSANLDIEKLQKSEPDEKSSPTKQSNKPKKITTAKDTAKYNGKQLVLGMLAYAKANKQTKEAYDIWLECGGLDFKKELKKKDCNNISQSVKYLLEHKDKTAQKIIDWINSHRKSAVAKFLNTYRERYFTYFSEVQDLVEQVSK